MEKTIFYTDVTTINAIDSYFRNQKSDEFGAQLATEFLELFVFYDQARIIFPYPSDKIDDPSEIENMPEFLRELVFKENLLDITKISSTKKIKMSQDQLANYFHTFVDWIERETEEAKHFIKVLFLPYFIEYYNTAVAVDFVTPVNQLKEDSQYIALQKKLNLTEQELNHVVNFILKYPYYKKIAKEHYYLSHPLRCKIKFYDVETQYHLKKNLPFDIKLVLRPLLDSLYSSNYILMLKELKTFIHDYSIHKVHPYDYDISSFLYALQHHSFHDEIDTFIKKLLLISGLIHKIDNEIGFKGKNPHLKEVFILELIKMNLNELVEYCRLDPIALYEILMQDETVPLSGIYEDGKPYKGLKTWEDFVKDRDKYHIFIDEETKSVYSLDADHSSSFLNSRAFEVLCFIAKSNKGKVLKNTTLFNVAFPPEKFPQKVNISEHKKNESIQKLIENVITPMFGEKTDRMMFINSLTGGYQTTNALKMVIRLNT